MGIVLMQSEKQLQNLRPIDNSNHEENVRRGKKGGKKSAEARARRKTLKEDLLAILGTQQQNGKTIQENWITALAKNLLKGDVKTSIFVRDTIGERPKELLELETNDISGIKIKFVDKTNAKQGKENDPKIVGDYTPPSNIEE